MPAKDKKMIKHNLTMLPNDATIVAYRKVSPFHYEPVFYSKIHDFKGMERDFVTKGIAYKYIQLDKYRIQVLEAV